MILNNKLSVFIMNRQEIQAYIFLTLAKLYEDPYHRKQYKSFTFKEAEEEVVQEIFSELTRNFIVDQIQPKVVRLTEFGYKIIQPDLTELRAEEAGNRDKSTKEADKFQLPTPEEIEKISRVLEQPDYISVSRFLEGRSEVYWATEGFKKVTGYSLKELKEAGGSFALLNGSTGLEKLERIGTDLINGNNVSDEIEIVTKNGHRRILQFFARPRFDDAGFVIGTITAVKDVTTHSQAQ